MAKFIDIKAKIKIDKIINPTKRQIIALQNLPQRALDFFISQTPIDSGYARRNTSLESKKTIHADYAYAKRLDDGYSKQSPKGMVKPTEQFIKREFKKIFRRK